MPGSAFDPLAIPPDFWARSDVSEALRQRDIGGLLRLLRQWAGLSQTRIATATGIAQGRLSEYARDKHAMTAVKVWERIADGLDMPDAARASLGLASPQASPPDGDSARPAPEPEAELLRQIATARNIDPTVVRALQSETDAIRLLDRRLGAPAVAHKLDAHVSHIETSLRHSLRPGQRGPLAAVLADASALAGWQAIDMGRLPAAWAHFERATAAAREAGDPCLLAFAAGEQAYVLLDLHRCHEALEMVRAASDDTHTAIPHQIRGWLRAAEGEMAATAGQESACRRALDQAAREIGYGPSGEDLPYLALNLTHLARWRGNCLIHFGDPEIAGELSAALDAMDGSFTRAEAGLPIDLRHLGEVEAARELDKRTLARRRRVLGEDHPDTLWSAHNLAADLRQLGEVEAARELDEDTLARRRRVLGEDHPDTLWSADNLAVDLRHLGETGEGSGT